MENFSDQELIEELKKRIKQNKSVLEEKSRLLYELELVNQRLIESERMKSQFLSNIKNEIKNPLTSILGISKDIPNYCNDKGKLTHISQLIYHEAFSLDYQLRNIFVAAELEAGELTEEITHINIEGVIDQVVHSLEHLSKKKNISIKKIIRLNKKNFKSDAEKLHLILINLLSNSITFSMENGTIEIEVDSKDGKLNIAVRDNGIGINEVDQTKIYRRFKQLDSGSTKSYGGHGLGLSIVRDLLEMINGEIHLESKKNEGSTFTIMIPESDNVEDINSTLGGNEFLFEDGDELF